MDGKSAQGHRVVSRRAQAAFLVPVFALLLAAPVRGRPSPAPLPGSAATRVAVQAGFGERLIKPPEDGTPELRRHLRELRGGWSYSLDMTSFYNEWMGISLRHHGYRTFAGNRNIPTGFGLGDPTAKYAEDAIDIRDFGPALAGRLPFLAGRGAAVVQAGVSWVYYRDRAKFNKDETDNPFTIRGEGLAYPFSGGLDFAVYRNLALSGSIRYLKGTLRGFRVEAGPENEITKEKESLSRVDWGLGLALYF